MDGGGALLQERSERNDLELLQFVRLLYSSTQSPSNEILRWDVFMKQNLGYYLVPHLRIFRLQVLVLCSALKWRVAIVAK